LSDNDIKVDHMVWEDFEKLTVKGSISVVVDLNLMFRVFTTNHIFLNSSTGSRFYNRKVTD